MLDVHRLFVSQCCVVWHVGWPLLLRRTLVLRPGDLISSHFLILRRVLGIIWGVGDFSRLCLRLLFVVTVHRSERSDINSQEEERPQQFVIGNDETELELFCRIKIIRESGE